MVEHLENQFPSTYIVAVGFSLGGNIVTKYMGEQVGTLPDTVIGGISICQGYNAVEYVAIAHQLSQIKRIKSIFIEQLLNPNQIIFHMHSQGYKFFTELGEFPAFVFVCDDRKCQTNHP